MNVDPEIAAMSSVTDALKDLDVEARKRVLGWASKRFAVSVSTSGVDEPENGSGNDETNDATEYEEFHELFEAAAPESGLDRLLAVAYWFQVIKGQASLDGYSLNNELKHMGHASSNVTRDMNSLMGRSPALAIKIRKEGSTKQARNQYKLTRAGIQAVEEMLAS